LGWKCACTTTIGKVPSSWEAEVMAQITLWTSVRVITSPFGEAFQGSTPYIVL
jgi:hypothetical protein